MPYEESGWKAESFLINRIFLYTQVYWFKVTCSGWVHDVAFSPSGCRLAFVAHDSTISLIDTNRSSQEAIVLRTAYLPFTSVHWVTENSLIAAVCFFKTTIPESLLPFSIKLLSFPCHFGVDSARQLINQCSIYAFAYPTWVWCFRTPVSTVCWNGFCLWKPPTVGRNVKNAMIFRFALSLFSLQNWKTLRIKRWFAKTVMPFTFHEVLKCEFKFRVLIYKSTSF